MQLSCDSNKLAAGNQRMMSFSRYESADILYLVTIGGWKRSSAHTYEHVTGCWHVTCCMQLSSFHSKKQKEPFCTLKLHVKLSTYNHVESSPTGQTYYKQQSVIIHPLIDVFPSVFCAILSRTFMTILYTLRCVWILLGSVGDVIFGHIGM